MLKLSYMLCSTFPENIWLAQGHANEKAGLITT